jgi:streptomycin 6-kinase
LIDPGLIDRMQQHAREWGVAVEHTLETETSLIATGTWHSTAAAGDTQPVVLKVIKHKGDEWRSGEILEAFNGNGVARVYEWAPGAVLLERLSPGNSLVELTLNGRDEEATDILAAVIELLQLHRRKAKNDRTASSTTISF